jgi:hypothetical protein
VLLTDRWRNSETKFLPNFERNVGGYLGELKHNCQGTKLTSY